MNRRRNTPHPQYYKTSDDLVQKMPEEEEWPEELVDGINKALKSAHAISEETYGSSSHSEIVSIDINIGSPWRLMADFTGTRTGADPGTATFTSECRYMKHYDGSVEFQGRYSSPTPVGYPATFWTAHTLPRLPEVIRPAYSLFYPIYGQQNSAGVVVDPSYVGIDSGGNIAVIGSNPATAVAAGSAPTSFYLNFRYMAADPRPFPVPGFPTSFRVSCKDPPIGVIPIACVEENKKVVRPGPMLAAADWKFSKKTDSGVITISNLAFSGFNNRIKVWFLVLYK